MQRKRLFDSFPGTLVQQAGAELQKRMLKGQNKSLYGLLAAVVLLELNLGAQPTASWNELYVGNRPQHRNYRNLILKEAIENLGTILTV